MIQEETLTPRRLRKSRKPIYKKEWKSQKKTIMEGAHVEANNPQEGTRLPIPSRRDANENSMFQSSPLYILDNLNSIAYENERFYNLLKIRPRSLWGRILKCKCSKSRCEARYCECFSHGQICGSDCSCTNCNNSCESKHTNSNSVDPKDEVGCKCSKSQCLKNYCECFQRGMSCGDNCKCTNCRNYL